MITIDKDIPLPETFSDGKTPSKMGRKPLYPFEELQVGESFFAPMKSQGMLHTFPNTVSRWRVKLGRKFKYTVCTQGWLRGFRVWRVE
jgi:hypothetical protein